MHTPDFEPGDLVEIILDQKEERRIVVYGGETDNYIRYVGVARIDSITMEWGLLPLSRTRLTWHSIVQCRQITETDNWPLEQLTGHWLELGPREHAAFLEQTKVARDLLSER